MSIEKQLLALLRDSYIHLQTLEPLNGTESSSKVSNWCQFLTHAYRDLGKLQEALSGIIHGSVFNDPSQLQAILGAQGEPDNDQENDYDELARDDEPDEETSAAETRYLTIQEGCLRAFPIVELHNLLFYGRKGPHKEQEHDAFRRLICGYDLTNRRGLERLFSNMLPPSRQWEELHSKSIQLDRVLNTVDRMMEREAFLYHGAQKDNLSSYVYYVIRSVHMLKISFDWKNKNGELQDENKKEFLDRLFCKFEAQEIKRLQGILGGDKLVKKHKAKFIRKHEKAVASRNHVRKLYEKASPSILAASVPDPPSAQFGAAVLLDPKWDIVTGLRATPRSRNFGATLQYTLRALEDDQSEDEWETQKVQSRQTLLILIQILAGQDLANWVGISLDELDDLYQHPTPGTPIYQDSDSPRAQKKKGKRRAPPSPEPGPSKRPRTNSNTSSSREPQPSTPVGAGNTGRSLPSQSQVNTDRQIKSTTLNARMLAYGERNGWPCDVDFLLLPRRVYDMEDDLLTLLQRPDDILCSPVWKMFKVMHPDLRMFAQGRLVPPMTVKNLRVGYYGEKGYFILCAILRSFLNCHSAELLLRTVHPLPLSLLIDYILAPHVAIVLIGTDLSIDPEAAAVTMTESSDFGYAIHVVSDDDDDPEFDDIIQGIFRRFKHRM